ncbi:MAG: LPXTG cell wall anchor domain-containing protein [Eubacterium sp.]|nr:LPXTG cell wall anchor domain-containing protein [Eubacterium sp.]
MKNDLRELLKMLRQMKLSETTRKRCRSAIAMMVVFITTYTLIMPAVALERKNVPDVKGLNLSEQNVKALNCHFPVHQHTEECYKKVPEYDAGGRKTGTKKVLNCWKADWVVHEHDANCYENGLLVCSLPEYMEHIHDASCYTMQRVLTCDKEETPGHRHTDACYQTTQNIVCGMDEHRHSEQCYSDVVTGTEQKLVCGYDEGEELSPAVYSDPVVDEETGETIEEAHLVQDAVVHHHTDSCYETETKTERQLTCGLTEHVHSDACYQTESKLICGQAEGEGHTHTDACYKEEKVLTCTELAPHQHTIDCYEKGPKGESPLEMGWVTLTYDEYGNEILNGDPNHLICGKIELLKHQHDDGCFENMTADAGENTDNMTAGDAEAQENETAGEADYQADGSVSDMGLQEEGTGEDGFYENEITFDENGNPIEHPDGDDTNVEGQDDATPSGLIVLHPDDEEAQADDSEISEDAENVDAEDTDAEEKDEQGDADEESADAEDTEKASEEGTAFTKIIEVEGASYSLIVSGEEACGIPENAVFKATAISENRDDYDAYREKALAAVDNYTTEETSRAEEMPGLFDLTIYDEDGNEIQPAAPLSIRVDLGDAIDKEASGIYAVHFPGTNADTIMQPTPDNPVGKAAQVISEKITGTGAEVIETTTEDDGAVQFEAESLSVYAIVYTVDFHWEVDGKKYEFSIPGGGFVSFTDLVEMLGIMGDTNTANGPDDAEVSDAAKEFVKDVASIEFSSPELLWVGKIDADSSVGELKETNGLECEYSAELTEEQITEIDAHAVETGDWAMISRKPFTSVETLTVTMKDGEIFTIRVTDAQISTNVLTADGKTYKITVTYEDDAGIPDGTKLFAKEIEPGTDEYLQHLGQAWTEVNKEYFELEEKKQNNNGELGEYEDIRPVNLDDARFFNVSLIHSGKEIEPKTPVHVDIEYVEGFLADAKEEDQVIGVAHYKKDETELITDVETERNETGEVVEFVYEQDSFSDIGTYVGQKTYDNVPYKMSQALAMPMLRALSNTTGNGAQLKDIEAHKSLTNNNDGTYTMSLTVKGDAVAYEEYNKANILFVMDRSSSMTNNNVYQEYKGTSYNSNTTYYRKNGDNYEALFLHNGQICTRSWSGGMFGSWVYSPYTGTVYTSVTRLAAEQAAMDVLIQNLLAKNDKDTPGKEDLIEISVISFARTRCSGNTEYTNWTSSDYEGVMGAVNQTSTPSGTNWEEALIYAQEQAALKKAAQPDEDVYVIFLTDGEPTAVHGETGGAYHYDNQEGGFEYALTEVGGPYNSHGRIDDEKNSLDRAKEIVDAKYKFYGIFTFNPGEAQTRYLRRLMNFAYTGVDKAYENDQTKEDTDIVKKYFTNADTPETLTAAFEKIFADVSNMLGHGDIVITDGLQAADAMTTTIHADRADGFRYSVTDDTGEELYYVTATGNDSNPTVTFHVDGHDYPAGAAKQGVGGKPYYSVTVNGTEYKMALADLSGRELQWDLSAIGMLIPNCTYKVDIIVWPNQDAYDYVAGLNNQLPGYTWDSSVESNPDNYHEVTVNGVTYGYYTGGVSGHSSIVKYKDSGVFSVLTNTHQELNYSIVNTKTNEVTGETTMTSDPQAPVPLEPQKPMDLVDTSSSIEKQWNVDLDPSILAQLLYPADGSHYTLTFDILQDKSTTPYKTLTLGWDAAQNKYVWESGSERDIEYNGTTYSIGTTWKKDFAVPTGLMLSEERMDALGMDKSLYPSGTYPVNSDDPNSEVKTYYILEDGHDYTIKERNLSYEFDFNADVFHPMLVDGKMQNVNFTKNGTTVNITNMTNTTGGLSSLKVENTLRGYIHLEKHVVDESNNLIDSDKTKFEYTIELTNDDAPFVGTHIPWYGINGLYYHDRAFNYYQVYYENNALKIKNEAGTVYEVTNNYDLNNAQEQSLKYRDGEEVKELLISGNETSVSEGNKLASAVLQISQGEILSIANVPAGTQYIITESAKPGYSLVKIDERIDPNDVQKKPEDTTVNLEEGSITGTIVPNHHNYIDYTNRCLVTDITIQKTDTDGEGLEGAVFQMKTVSEDGHSEADATTIDSISGIGDVVKRVDGETITFPSSFESTGEIQTISGLPDGTYRLYEVHVPEGYIRTYQYIQFEVENREIKNVTTDTGDTSKLDTTADNIELKIANEPGAALPNTGGTGTRLFTILGSLLILGAGVLLWKRWTTDSNAGRRG